VTVSASASIFSADAKPEDPHANREHLVRKADGGTDHDSNIVMACAACNHERGDAPVDAYKKASCPAWHHIFAVDCTPVSLVSVKILDFLAPRRASEGPSYGSETSLFNALAAMRSARRAETTSEANREATSKL
jgi:hypothetical protein